MSPPSPPPSPPPPPSPAPPPAPASLVSPRLSQPPPPGVAGLDAGEPPDSVGADGVPLLVTAPAADPPRPAGDSTKCNCAAAPALRRRIARAKRRFLDPALPPPPPPLPLPPPAPTPALLVAELVRVRRPLLRRPEADLGVLVPLPALLPSPLLSSLSLPFTLITSRRSPGFILSQKSARCALDRSPTSMHRPRPNCIADRRRCFGWASCQAWRHQQPCKPRYQPRVATIATHSHSYSHSHSHSCTATPQEPHGAATAPSKLPSPASRPQRCQEGGCPAP